MTKLPDEITKDSIVIPEIAPYTPPLTTPSSTLIVDAPNSHLPDAFAAAYASLTFGRGKSLTRTRNDPRISKVGDFLRVSNDFQEFFEFIRKTDTSNQARFHVLVTDDLLKVLWEFRKDIPPQLLSASQIISWLMLKGLENIHATRQKQETQC